MSTDSSVKPTGRFGAVLLIIFGSILALAGVLGGFLGAIVAGGARNPFGYAPMFLSFTIAVIGGIMTYIGRNRFEAIQWANVFEKRLSKR